MPDLDIAAVAQCRKPGRDPAWWDVEADDHQRAVARRLCRHCRAWSACTVAAAAFGAAISGTWAGEFYPWDGAAHNADDATLLEYLTAFGPSAAHNDLTTDDQLELFTAWEG